MSKRDSFKVIECFEGLSYLKNYTGYNGQAPITTLKGAVYTTQNPSMEFAPYDIETKDLRKNGQLCSLGFDESILSKHVLIAGGIGMGKTNTFNYMINDISNALTTNDVMLIFDTKGDFYRTFSCDNSRDVLIANSPISNALGKMCESRPFEIWNIFQELPDPAEDDSLNEMSNEIASMLFANSIKQSTQPFFPMAARSIFASLLRILKRTEKNPSNLTLKKLLTEQDSTDDFFNDGPSGIFGNIVRLLKSDPREIGALDYINCNESGEKDGQTLGVIAELRLVVEQIFIGNFAKEGSFSIRQAIQSGNGKRIFLEYDIVEGETLSPVYSLLVDLAIKEALNQRKRAENQKRNFYFMVDEFKLLPHLKHIDDAVNFGRSIGVKFVIGIQNISQIKENYGEDRAMNILSGFSTTIAFHVSDYATRQYFVELFGINRKRTAYLSMVNSRGLLEQVERANVVEDWDILSLEVGECIVRLPKIGRRGAQESPFYFQMLPWSKMS